jgi:hypothetical protein
MKNSGVATSPTLTFAPVARRWLWLTSADCLSLKVEPPLAHRVLKHPQCRSAQTRGSGHLGARAPAHVHQRIGPLSCSVSEKQPGKVHGANPMRLSKRNGSSRRHPLATPQTRPAGRTPTPLRLTPTGHRNGLGPRLRLELACGHLPRGTGGGPAPTPPCSRPAPWSIREAATRIAACNARRNGCQAPFRKDGR